MDVWRGAIPHQTGCILPRHPASEQVRTGAMHKHAAPKGAAPGPRPLSLGQGPLRFLAFRFHQFDQRVQQIGFGHDAHQLAV